MSGFVRHLRRELHAPYEILKSRIRAEAIKSRVGIEMNQVGSALPVSRLEPFESSIVIPQAMVNERNVVR